MLMKICTVLLVVWYCMSIIGFDVHTCMGSGRVFVTTFAEGMTCADIHPDHHCGTSCHHDACCGRHAQESCGCHAQGPGTSVASAECCTDAYQVILLTGCRADDDSQESGITVCSRDLHLSSDCLSTLRSFKYTCPIHYNPDSWDIVPCDPCVTFGIWRI